MKPITTARLKRLAKGAEPKPDEVPLLAQLALQAREAEQAADIVILEQSASAAGDHSWRYSLRIDRPIDNPDIKPLLGWRVRLMPVEKVLRGWMRGERVPKGQPIPTLVDGVRPPHGWQAIEADAREIISGHQRARSAGDEAKGHGK